MWAVLSPQRRAAHGPWSSPLSPLVLSSERPRLDFCSRWRCPTPPILCQSPNFQDLRMGGAFKEVTTRLLGEGGYRSNLSGVLIRMGNWNERKRHPRCASTEQRPHEDLMRRRSSASWRARPQEKPSLQRLVVGLPASGAGRNTCLLFGTPSLWYFVVAA